ncbi:hypothetical protein ABT084_36775 [Streptomyces sp. NPDC002138]|uniref:hypothetical protein n=1 Tax=Streptomyces sp. NPDC002138 TaxID=3154410 RepID=UPI0033334068
MRATPGVPEFDPVRRMRVLAAALDAPMHAEAHINAPFAEVWTVAADLERELPHLVPGLLSLTVEDGPRGRTARACGPCGREGRFDLVLQPGWCLMQSPEVFGGMAAVAEGGGTRFAVFGGLRPADGAPLDRRPCPRDEARARRVIERARVRVAARWAG